MKVSELKEKIKEYKEEDLRLLLTEMYKAIPKKVREEKNIDKMVRDIREYIENGKGKKDKGEELDFAALEKEVERFLNFAYEQYYMIPNSFVHKNERPKWRFIVKNYYKQLQTIPVDSENGQKATVLLEKLYDMMSYACHYYLFRSDDPFASAGIIQTEFLDIVLKRKLAPGINRESIKECLTFVINSNVDRVTSHIKLFYMLIANLSTPDAKKTAIEQGILLKKELKEQAPPSKFSDDYYWHCEQLNHLTEGIIELYIVLCEYDDGIAYFNKNYQKKPEIVLFYLLMILFKHGLKDLWVREYESAVKRGIEPRDRLKNTYQYIKENGKLPEYMS